jgi:hypothetical protein
MKNISCTKLLKQLARNAENGRFVTKKYAQKHPKATVIEVVNKQERSCSRNNKILDKPPSKIKEKLRTIAKPISIQARLKLLGIRFQLRNSVRKDWR